MSREIMQSYSHHYVGGEWIRPYSTSLLNVINPSTEAVIAEVVAGNQQDAERAVEAAAKAFPTWAATSASERQAILLKVASLMEARKEDLVQAISSSMGCPPHIARWLHVEDPIQCMRLFAGYADELEKIEERGSALIYREPIGVCGLISPWNYPLHQMISKVGAALAAGCTIVVKPSEITPLQDFIMAEIFHEAGLPAGVFNLVPGTGAEVGQVLSAHPKIDLVSFTGSTRAGIEVAKAAAPTVKRVAQELGGKSPLIITESADLEEAVKYGVEDVMLNSGQTCTALTRMLVPASTYDQAIEIAKNVADTLQFGQDDDAFMGPVASPMQYEKVLDYIDIGKREGATLLCGGVADKEAFNQGFYIEPTIFTHVNNSMRIAQEEIFGPVLCMLPYENLDEAISIANDTPYGLSSGVYAGSDEEAIAVARRIRAGMCFINGGVFNCDMPFGGVKQSGNGRELSVEGVTEFMELKSIQRK